MVGGKADQESEEPTAPCGDCRQKLLEHTRPGNDPMVIMAGTRGDIIRISLKTLLPFGFFPASLMKA